MIQKSKHQVLLIDDNLVWGEYFAKAIGDNYIIKYYTDIESSINEIRTNPNIDIVITDIVLSHHEIDEPSNEIFGMIESIKRFRPDIPIIVYTAYYDNKLEALQELGVDAIFSKTNVVAGDRIKVTIEKLIRNSLKAEKEKTEEDIAFKKLRMMLKDEIEQYAIIKEKTLSIPEEGNFEVIKPLRGFKRDIEKQISKFGYSKNVFLMMKFRNANKELSDFIIENLAKHGFMGIRADQNSWNITKNVYNPLAVLYCCKYGIALFDEPEDHQAYSPNVAYELGIMHHQNKNCLILKHESLPSIPFDLIKDIYVNYSKDLHLKKVITDWIIQISND